jgi:hypothetical protein
MAALLLFSGAAFAQTNLAGRVYQNEHINAGKMWDLDKTIAQEKAKAVAEAEKKKGRKLNAKEKQELEAEMKKVTDMSKALQQGTIMGITVEFKTAQQASMKAKIHVSDDALKKAGMGWVKRKAFQAAMAMSPTAKMTYSVKGNKVICCEDKNDCDTFYISPDGKQLTGIFVDQKSKQKIQFTLARKK